MEFRQDQNLFMQAKSFWGLDSDLELGAGLVVGALESNSHADFTLMDSNVLRSYVPQFEAGMNGSNFVRNGDFAENWNETLSLLQPGLLTGDMTEFCNWTILQDIGWNNNLGKDGFGWNVQLKSSGAISQLVPTKMGQEHTLQFQGLGLDTCGVSTRNVSLSVIPSSKNFSIASIPAGVGWQLQSLDFVPTAEFVNLTIASASDTDSDCGASITDVKIGLKGDLISSSPGQGTQTKSLKMAAAVLGSVIPLAALVAFISIRTLRRSGRHGHKDETTTRYNFRQIKRITRNFPNKIGSGGYSSVYLGKLGDGTEVAVKRSLKPEVNFKDEVHMLSRIHHRRIVRFLGFCDEKDEQILVSEYMEIGSLHDVLHKRSHEGFILTFGQRLKIARDIAQGLEYLHHGARPGVIHRDIKPANVLIDRDLSGKLADFGISKQGHENTFSLDSPIETDWKGTRYYIDPVYATDSTISTKSDVYSFGVLLLELVTGQKAIVVHSMISMHESSRMWMNPNPEMLSDIVDPLMKVGSACDAESLQNVVSTAYKCLHPERERRPSMNEVVRALGPEEATKKPLGPEEADVLSISTRETAETGTEIPPGMIEFTTDSTVQESTLSTGR